jgi:hypothetical protein
VEFCDDVPIITEKIAFVYQKSPQNKKAVPISARNGVSTDPSPSAERTVGIDKKRFHYHRKSKRERTKLKESPALGDGIMLSEKRRFFRCFI